jgi:hypothetical protein
LTKKEEPGANKSGSPPRFLNRMNPVEVAFLLDNTTNGMKPKFFPTFKED